MSKSRYQFRRKSADICTYKMVPLRFKEYVNKVFEGRPNIVDMLKDGAIALVMNTAEGAQAVEDSREIRSVALYDKIPYFTTLAGSHAAALAIRARQEGELGVMALQGSAA